MLAIHIVMDLKSLADNAKIRSSLKFQLIQYIQKENLSQQLRHIYIYEHIIENCMPAKIVGHEYIKSEQKMKF